MKLFDAHFHIIDSQFPLVANNGYLPPYFTISDYTERTKNYEIVGGTVVSGSFQGFDQEYLVNTLKVLGNNFYGVANIPEGITDEELERLNAVNVVAVRFNLKRGNSEKVKYIEKLSNYLFDRYNWHTELYIDSRDLNNLKPVLKNIPNFSIDHLGLSKEGLKDLFYWAERGVKIKCTGFGRIDFNPVAVMKTLNSINSRALMLGTDLPSTRAKVPFSDKDIHLVLDNFSDDTLKRIFYKNAIEWYSKK